MRVNDTVYVSGCLGLNKESLKLVPGGAASEAEKALENLTAVLNASGSKLENGEHRKVLCFERKSSKMTSLKFNVDVNFLSFHCQYINCRYLFF